MTPTVRYCCWSAYTHADLIKQAFCERIKAEFAGLDNVEIHVRDEGAEDKVLRLYVPLTLQDSFQPGPKNKEWCVPPISQAFSPLLTTHSLLRRIRSCR